MVHDIWKMVNLNHYYLKMANEDPDSFFRYNRTELKKLSDTADRAILNTCNHSRIHTMQEIARKPTMNN